MAKDSLIKNNFVLASMLIILAVALIVYVDTITGFVSFRPVVSAPEKPVTLISYSGGVPIIDGQVTADDKWDQADSSTINYERGTVKIASKHDYKYIYFLVQWDDAGPAWNDQIAFYFEDDGITHNHFLDGKNEYSFKNLVSGCQQIEGGYILGGANDWVPGGANFDVNCIWENGKWSMEVRHLLSDTKRGDQIFDIPQYKQKLMGIAIVNWEENSMGGSGWDSWNWPIDHKAGARYGTNPSEPATWGDLKVVWTAKPVAKAKK